VTAKRYRRIPRAGGHLFWDGCRGVSAHNTHCRVLVGLNPEIRTCIAVREKLPACRPKNAGTCARSEPCRTRGARNPSLSSNLKDGIVAHTAAAFGLQYSAQTTASCPTSVWLWE